jgi:transposase
MTNEGIGSCTAAALLLPVRIKYEVYVGQTQILTLRPRQVIVVDGLLPHKGEGGVHELLERWGCNVLYLLPYSLDLNPVEEGICKVNSALRRAGARTREALVGAMDRALYALVAWDARAFFEHCGNRLSALSL